MSSISLRSYRLRRKSAEARLETPAVREDEPRRPERSRRVKSALETRREHESSKDVFPEAETTKIANPTWGISRYTEDYGRKTPVPPVPMRPISPTRRNNPHPSQVRYRWWGGCTNLVQDWCLCASCQIWSREPVHSTNTYRAMQCYMCAAITIVWSACTL